MVQEGKVELTSFNHPNHYCPKLAQAPKYGEMKMFGLRELKSTIKITKKTVECPVKSCEEKVHRQREFFRKEEKFKCPKHNIYISPSTFEYHNWQDNILWKEKADLDLLKNVKTVKRETRIARDNSEDAVTWNIFRFLEKNKLLSGLLANLNRSAVKNPEIIYWSYSQSEQSAWSELQKARKEFETRPRKGSEPDIIVKSDSALFFVEAKLTASNNTVCRSRNPKVQKKYETGGDRWYKRVFCSPFETIAISKKKYELLRFWLIGSWIAKRLQLDFRFINLVLSERERDIEKIFRRHIKQDQRRRFVRITWEDIYAHILESNSSIRDRGIIKRYFENKTIGYDRNRKLQKAFSMAF